MTEQKTKQNEIRLNGFPATGVYAGPLTQRAMDYDGHLTIGIQISDPAADGSCLFMNLDEHMQVYITPVLASSIAPYDPPEPPPDPECTEAELADTRKDLEWLLKLQIDHGISSIGDLRACALTMSDLADVIELQAGASTCTDEVDTLREPTEVNTSTCTNEVGTACRAADGASDTERRSRESWPKIRQYVSGCTGSVGQEEICGHTVFNDLGQPVGWVDIDLTGGTVSDESIDPAYAEDAR